LGKTVLIRCDLNVPMDASLNITDDTRIVSSIPTVEYLTGKGAKCLLCSHLGRPKDGPEEKFSLKPVAKKMGDLMKKDVKMAPDCMATDDVKAMVKDMSDGDVMILENTRFYKGETKNDPVLAESMASLADLFVNDAFGTAHRAHSSTEGVTKFLSPSVSGFLLKKELDYLDGAISKPKRPMAAIVGGAKVSTKIPVIESMLEKVDKLVIGGGMVFTFLKARGLSVGKSLVEEDFLEMARRLASRLWRRMPSRTAGWAWTTGPRPRRTSSRSCRIAKQSSGTAPWVSSRASSSPMVPTMWPRPSRS